MASRFWVGGTGTWDASDTSHWAASSGGAAGQSVPGSSDTVTLDGSSGGGTVTINTTIAVLDITCGAFTGTLDFSANNNNVTLTSTTGFSGSGTGTRTFNLGNGIWTLSATSGNIWNVNTPTNLTLNANSSSIVFSGTGAGVPQFLGGGKTYNNLTINANSNRGGITIVSANTFASLTVGAPNTIIWPGTLTNTITNAFTFAGTGASPIAFLSSLAQNAAILSLGGDCTIDWGAVRGITKSGAGSLALTNGFNLGLNTTVTITPPPSPTMLYMSDMVGGMNG